MTGLFYNSISSGLTENKIIEIDKRVAKNWEVFYLFIIKLPSNSKDKTKSHSVSFTYNYTWHSEKL